MPSSYQVVLWKQESFVVLRQIEFFRNLLGVNNWENALGLGFVLWFSFYFVQLSGAVMWDNLPWQLGLVHSGDWLMKMLFMSLLLSAWHGRKLSSEILIKKESKTTI
jgi:uncharacterized protein DUF1761